MKCDSEEIPLAEDRTEQKGEDEGRWDGVQEMPDKMCMFKSAQLLHIWAVLSA
jgi:hypothetical protein